MAKIYVMRTCVLMGLQKDVCGLFHEIRRTGLWTVWFKEKKGWFIKPRKMLDKQERIGPVNPQDRQTYKVVFHYRGEGEKVDNLFYHLSALGWKFNKIAIHNENQIVYQVWRQPTSGKTN